MVIAAPSLASAAGTHAMPMTLPELARVARARDLADGLAARVEHRGALGGHVAVGQREADERASLGPACSAACSSAHLPMKSSSLSSLTIQGIAAP